MGDKVLPCMVVSGLKVGHIIIRQSVFSNDDSKPWEPSGYIIVVKSVELHLPGPDEAVGLSRRHHISPAQSVAAALKILSTYTADLASYWILKYTNQII